MSPLRILVIQLRQVGDVLLAGPLVAALQRAHPQAPIDFLVEEYAAEAALGLPGVAGTVVVSRTLSPLGFLGLLRTIRSRAYGLVVDAQGNQKTGLLTWASGAPIRVGFRAPWYKLPYRMFYTHTVERDLAPKYSARFKLDLLRPLGIPEAGDALAYRTRPEARESVGRALAPLAGPGPLVGLSPGGRVDWKSWPLERYRELALRLRARGRRLLVLAGPGELPQARALAAEVGAGVEASAGFAEHAALVERLDGLVTNDGGNLHLAVALGVPTVAIFGPTDPRIWAAPGPGPHRVVAGTCTCHGREVFECRPRRCLASIPATEVERALDELLAARAGKEGGP